MRVLVTGGAGFIGSHLVERLTELGHSVRVLDDLSTGRNERLLRELGAELIVGDVADRTAVASAVEGCDAVCHLAAVASVAASMERPLETLNVNIVGAATVFEAAARAAVRRVAFASSAAVYGATQDLPLRESALPMPLSPYAADKLAGEHYLAHFTRTGALDGNAFRFFNVYGPRQDPSSPYSGVISVFIDRALAGRPLVVHGDGSQTRDFVYVKDVVQVLASALTGERYGDGADRQGAEMPVTNVARGRSVTVLELASTVVDVVGNPAATVEFGPPRPGDVKYSLADVTLLKERFGAVPATDLTTGLAATVDASERVV